MLIDFSIENFLSMKDEVLFSMLASSDNSHEYNLISDKKTLKKDRLLRSAVIYGANASGKSNVIHALNYTRNLILNSSKNVPGEKIPFYPFKLDSEQFSKPCKIKVDFIEDGVRYNYGVSLNAEKVIDEYLYYYPKGTKSIIFERSNTNDYKFTKDKGKQRSIADRTLENVLYFSNSAQQNYEKTKIPFMWFSRKLQMISSERMPREITVEIMQENEGIEDWVIDLLYLADFGISNLDATIKKVDVDELPDHLKSFIKYETAKEQEEGSKKEEKNSIPEIKKADVKFYHNGRDKTGNPITVPFEYDDESEGTKRFFSLIGPFTESLKKGYVLLVDELESKLHPLLCEALLSLFNNPEINRNGAQLIFTSHNTHFLDVDLLRRDQIWFTEKNEGGVTDLYSLLEYNPRKNANIDKGYLNGKYGALPFIGNLEGLLK